MAQDTPWAQSTDTPESVAAGLYARLVIGADPIMQDPAYEMDKLHDALLAAERAKVQAMREALEEGRQQIEYLHGKYQETGSGNAVIAKIDAALSTPPAEQPAPADTLARELAEVVDETWTFLAVWSQTYASERRQPLAPVHAKMLARVHAVMTRAHAAGLIPTLTTTRLPVILAEHGYGADGLLTEGEGRDNG